MASYLDQYKKRLELYGVTDGRVRKNQSDEIMEYTWWEDIQSQVGYIYDMYHDDEPLEIFDLSPQNSPTKIPIDIKFMQNMQQTYAKDYVDFKILLRPSQECNVDYYSWYEQIYGSKFPVGLYIDIRDENGKYNKWMIVDTSNYHTNQFLSYSVLPCNYIYKFVCNNIKYQIVGISRQQNSYNSGIWRSDIFTVPQDQTKFILPLNRDTEHIYHNQRICVDANVLTEPVCWLVSKVHRFQPNGILNVTLTEDKFDQEHDYVEKDDNGNVIAVWCDYFSQNVSKEELPMIPNENTDNKVVLQYKGTKPQLKVNGSAKTIIASVIDGENNEVDSLVGDWSFDFKDAPYKTLFDITNVNDKQIKIKYVGDDTYLNKVITVTYKVGEESDSLDLEIVGL